MKKRQKGFSSESGGGKKNKAKRSLNRQLAIQNPTRTTRFGSIAGKVPPNTHIRRYTHTHTHVADTHTHAHTRPQHARAHIKKRRALLLVWEFALSPSVSRPFWDDAGLRGVVLVILSSLRALVWGDTPGRERTQCGVSPLIVAFSFVVTTHKGGDVGTSCYA